MRFNPWGELRRRVHIVFRLAALPTSTGGAVYYPKGNRAAIIIDPELSRVERRAALTHELVHDSHGGGVDTAGMPPLWQAIAARDEAAVDREVARLLVPPDELLRFCDARLTVQPAVGPVDVSEYFDVPEWVAVEALRRIA